MKKRVLAIVLIFAFILTSSSFDVEARRARSFGSSRSFSKSFSRSIKSSARKSSSLFGSSSKAKSNYSRNIFGSKTNSKASAKGFASKATSKKFSYMKDTYKKQVSSKNYNTYKQKLNSQQKKIFNDSLKKDYGIGSTRMRFEDAINTRSSRIKNFTNRRPIYINVNRGMFSSPFSYGYAYVGPWDLWFLMRASDLFWYHHWNEITPYRSYFDNQEFNKLEKRVQELEQQGIKRDPTYLEPGVDPDLQLSQQYQEQNVDKIYYTDKYPAQAAGRTVVIIIITSVALVIIIRKISRPKKKKAHYSSIY